MADENLHQLLERLHVRLADTRSAPAEDRALIQDVLADLTRLVERAPREGDAAQAHGLGERIVRLEASHPDLVAIVRQIVEALARAGV